MPKPISPGDMLQHIKKNILNETKKTFEHWVIFAKNSGISKHKALTDWLKEKGLPHNQAIWVAWEVIDPGRSTQYDNPKELVDKLYSGKKAHLRPLYDSMIEKSQTIDAAIKVVTCKTYSSLRTTTQFAIIIPRTQNAIDIELALPANTKPSKQLESYQGHNDKYNFRMRITSLDDINAYFMKQIQDAVNYIKKV